MNNKALLQPEQHIPSVQEIWLYEDRYLLLTIFFYCHLNHLVDLYINIKVICSYFICVHRFMMIRPQLTLNQYFNMQWDRWVNGITDRESYTKKNIQYIGKQHKSVEWINVMEVLKIIMWGRLYENFTISFIVFKITCTNLQESVTFASNQMFLQEYDICNPGTLNRIK